MRPPIFFYRHELHEYAMIQEKDHAVVVRVALRGKKPFARIVHVQIMDVLPDQVPELPVIRSKGHAAMDVKFQRRPYLRQRSFSGDLKYTPDQYQRPGRHTRYGSDIFLYGILCKPLDLVLPFVQQRYAQFRRPDPVSPERRILQEDRTEVSIMHVFVHLADGMAAADDETFSCQQIGVRIEVIVHGQYVLRALIMAVLEAFFADGDEFAFVAGGTAAFGKPVDRGIPENVLFPVHDPLDVGLQIVVLMYGHGLFVFADGKDLRKIVFTSEFRVLSRCDEMLQHLPLYGDRMLHPMLNAAKTQSGESRYGRAQEFHGIDRQTCSGLFRHTPP